MSYSKSMACVYGTFRVMLMKVIMLAQPTLCIDLDNIHKMPNVDFQGNRDEGNTVDIAKARDEANKLYQAGEKKWGTDESIFNMILAVRNFAQLRATFDEYIKVKSGKLE